MVLEHVAHHPRLLVVLAPMLHAHGLRRGDLHVVHMVAVPQRLEDRVGEAEDQEVLDRLLAQVVIDAVDLVLGEGADGRARSALRALSRLRPNGFSMMTRDPGPLLAGPAPAAPGRTAASG